MLQRMIAAILSFLLGALTCHTGGGQLMEYDRYTLEAYMTPVWEGGIVYNETVMFVAKADGSVEPAPLLYEPLEILSLRSFDLLTEYEPGIDYTLEDGKIALTPDSRIYRWQYSDYYPAQAIPGATFERSGGGFIAFGEGDTFFKTQIAVTYRHKGQWNGAKPVFAGELQNTLEKLRAGEKLTVVYYGDSITTGANSSNTQAPFAPIWTQLVTAKLAEAYHHGDIEQVNTAVGGTNAKWGCKNAKQLVAAYRPDLAVIAFGMNDAGTSAVSYAASILGIIEQTRRSNPDAEFILVSPMLPNREVRGFYGNQYQFESVLFGIAAFEQGIAAVPVWSMHKYMLESKRYYDMTGNNVNHPNDFLARVYAQAVSSLLVCDNK